MWVLFKVPCPTPDGRTARDLYEKRLTWITDDMRASARELCGWRTSLLGRLDDLLQAPALHAREGARLDHADDIARRRKSENALPGDGKDGDSENTDDGYAASVRAAVPEPREPLERAFSAHQPRRGDEQQQMLVCPIEDQRRN